ncbi:MAG TPA: response regulator [Gallionella sp.]|nr:response regulator [Gallionella sp.]
MSNTEKSTLLVVDDTPENIDVMCGIFGADYTIKVANSGRLALEIVATQSPDLILLDVMMPGMDGYEVCRRLKENEATRDIPIIFVTALGETEDETLGFELGASDYIVKPVNPQIARARVRAHLALSNQHRSLEQLVSNRTMELERSNRQLEKTHFAMIQQLGRAADYRDNETGTHILRVGNYSKLLGLASGFTESQAELLMYASMMHDIGKIGVPDHILLKPDQLTVEELKVMKCHPEIGAGIIGDHEAEVLKMAKLIALTHHEKWNGQGYPHSLRGEDIPIVGRIVAIADVFDSLTCIRPYKRAWSMESAFELIKKEAGQHFDPELVRLFLSMGTEVRKIATEYSEAANTPQESIKVLPMSQPSGMKATILMVDDAPESIDVLHGILGADYTLKVATNGQLALKMAVAQPPDLILLDVLMSGIDGYEVFRQLKANPRTNTIPVIFITANIETKDEVLGLALGAADYLTKPVIPDIVKARVQTQLALFQMRRELEEKNLVLSDEKKLLEDIVSRMRSANPFDRRKVWHIQSSPERAAGDIVLSAYRPDGTQHVLAGDFSGHDMPAAFGGPLVSYIFYRLSAEGYAMRHILHEVNRILYRQLPTQIHMAAAALEFSPDREWVGIWNCGLPPALCLSATHGIKRIGSSGLPLGISEAVDFFEPHTQLKIEHDMHIYLYSDGITEAMSAERELYGQERTEALISRIHREELPLEIVWQELDTFCGREGLSDDAVMVRVSP